MATVCRVEALETLVDQLWAPGSGGSVRVDVGPLSGTAHRAGWTVAEEYWVLPGARRPRLLVPVAGAAVQRAALTAHRGLRRPTANLARAALGALASTPAPLSRRRLVVRTRPDAPPLPLARLTEELGRGPLHAAFGVRTGANRKATLQLLNLRGQVVGHAKLGWNPTADEYVRTETEALRAVGGRPAPMRAPGLLASFTQGGRPVAVVEPLPLDVRGVRGRQPAPSPEELYALCPVVRTGPAAGTKHLTSLGQRLRALAASRPAGADDAAEEATLLHHAVELLDRVEADLRPVPVQARWHGDLTPWNCARGADGQLWAWDWESSEEDVVAGLDALHWEFSVRRETGGLAELGLVECLDAARPHLDAAGVAASTRPLVAAVYLLATAERAATLARQHGFWEPVWISRPRLTELAREALRLLEA